MPWTKLSDHKRHASTCPDNACMPIPFQAPCSITSSVCTSNRVLHPQDINLSLLPVTLDLFARARLARLMVAFQAVWRGRCTRAKTTPNLAARRRESEETRCMFQEERLTECFVALEAERKELEIKFEYEELHTMR